VDISVSLAAAPASKPYDERARSAIQVNKNKRKIVCKVKQHKSLLADSRRYPCSYLPLDNDPGRKNPELDAETVLCGTSTNMAEVGQVP
jgi:hypothetical protein